MQPLRWYGSLTSAALLGLVLATGACGKKEEQQDSPPSPPPPPPAVDRGEQLFEEAFAGTNGRSCATCHVPEDHFTLTPEHVAELWESNPDDPLFNAIDADDPTADPLTFEHLKKGLIRVGIELPTNMDLLDDQNNIVTPPDRMVFVWRGVPSIADVALTAPYQLDGRVATLEEQAQGALTGHSQGGQAQAEDLALIADYERRQFTSDRAQTVAEELADGVVFEDVTDVEASLELTEQEARGQELYEKVCEACHGGANKAAIVDREIHDLGFRELKTDGTILYIVPATDPPTPVYVEQPDNEFMNVATSLETFLAMIGATEHEHFSVDVGFPTYRLRFYTDASQTEIAADLPPLASFDGDGGPGGPGGPGGGIPVELDEDGNPIEGPNGSFQLFSTDPGRALITGSPYDFEAFDAMTLRGIANTAPYFHDNSVTTLEDLVDLYSDHLLARFPSLIQPGEKEPDPDGDIGPEEIFTLQQKEDLVAFLKRL